VNALLQADGERDGVVLLDVNAALEFVSEFNRARSALALIALTRSSTPCPTCTTWSSWLRRKA
jgi:hypothetical protein